MEALEYQEWRNQHAQQEFPFVGSSPYFPDGIIVDMSIACYGSANLSISSLVVVGGSLVGSIQSDNGASYSFTQTTFNASNSNAPVITSGGNTVGTVVFGPNASDLIPQISPTSKSMNSVTIESSCVFTFAINQVASLVIAKKNYSGIINLVEGEGVSIGGTGQNIVINAIGTNSNLDCCTESYIPLKSINSIAPINGALLVTVRDIGQPLSSADPMQLASVVSIKNGIEISLNN